MIQAAEPNPAHVALAELAQAGRVELLVTQNVDGLHERSGFPAERLVNIHGTDSAVECVGCRRREPRAVAQQRLGGGHGGAALRVRRPVEAGDHLVRAVAGRGRPRRAFARGGARATSSSRSGTSLVVGPINQMLPTARDAGARTAILTASETPYDDVADWKIDERVESGAAGGARCDRAIDRLGV